MIGSILFPEEHIKIRVKNLAEEISTDFKSKISEENPLVLLTVLKGAHFFAADIAREMAIPIRMDYIRLKSYSGTKTTGRVDIVHRPACELKDQHILIIEDIVDTGLSLECLVKYLSTHQPASIKVCALLCKPLLMPLDYAGFTCPDCFVVGYGLDYNEQYRNLPYIASLTL